MDHTVFTLQTHHTCLYLISIHQTAPPLASLLLIYWPHQLQVRCRPRKVAGQRPMFYHWATPLTTD